MSDPETQQVYAAEAARYAAGFASRKNTVQEQDYTAFTALLPAGGRVLDLGCGPGHWAARFRDAGYVTEAMDASPEMAALALDRYGVTVRVATFDDFDDQARFDGIWANFSLLHAPRAQFPTYLQRVKQALKPGGALSLGMKLGNGEGRDSLGRFYAYYSEEDLVQALRDLDMTVTQIRRGNGKGLAGGVETFIVLVAHA
ncbi:MAG: class I SAM-dependent methyltransferase [Pelagimonas sp.]|jgi:SAM-dependent methyltransferase|nr:class I SAM-dependent methyltransferase [Pelagimonas sp.]